MDPVTAGLLIGGAGAIGNWLGGRMAGQDQLEAVRETNAANAAMSRENRDWQQWMSNTAHKREMRDLRAAGLNPILSATKGGMGASTPTPNTPVMQTPDMTYAGKGLAQFSNSGMAVANTVLDMQTKQAQIEATKAQAIAQISQAQQSQASAAATRAAMPKIVHEIAIQAAAAASAGDESQARRATAKYTAANAGIKALADSQHYYAEAKEANLRQKVAEFDLPLVTLDGVTKRLAQGISTTADAVGAFSLFRGMKRFDKMFDLKEMEALSRAGRRGLPMGR